MFEGGMPELILQTGLFGGNESTKQRVRKLEGGETLNQNMIRIQNGSFTHLENH